MSSEHDDHHGEDDGAHEIDKMPYARLFNLLVGLSALTLLSCIGVIQIFNLQVREIIDEYAAEGEKDSALTEYRTQSGQVAAGYGRYDFELEGKTEQRFYVPMATARKQVLEDAKLLDGGATYRGWEDSPVGKQIKDWGGLPTPPKPDKPPGVKGEEGKAPADGKAPANVEKPDGKAPAPEEKKAEEKKAEEKKEEPQTRGDDKGKTPKPAKGGQPSAGEAKAGG